MYNEESKKQANEQAEEQTLEQAEEQTPEYIIIKLNSLYKYINKGEGKIENVTTEDRKNILILLKKMDLLVSDEAEPVIIETNRLLKFKIYYWVIKELYFSSYREYLRKLTKETLNIKYLNSLKYVQKKPNYTILDLLNYLIKCLEYEAEEVLSYGA